MNDNFPFFKDLLSPQYTVVPANIKTSPQQKYLNHSGGGAACLIPASQANRQPRLP